MNTYIRLPNISARTLEGKVDQMQNYLYQMVEQLNWALNDADSSSDADKPSIQKEES